jgi:hypothetical protein
MSKDALRRRYHYLWTGEILSAFLFTGLLFWFAFQDGAWQRWVARTYSLSIVILILMQGVFWWRLKLRLLRHRKYSIPSSVLRSYRIWRRINWLLIGGFPLIAILAAQITFQPILSTDTGFGLLLLGGAILEQINYYYYQLMYDSPNDWAYLGKQSRPKKGAIARAFYQSNRSNHKQH